MVVTYAFFRDSKNFLLGVNPEEKISFLAEVSSDFLSHRLNTLAAFYSQCSSAHYSKFGDVFYVNIRILKTPNESFVSG